MGSLPVIIIISLLFGIASSQAGLWIPFKSYKPLACLAIIILQVAWVLLVDHNGYTDEHPFVDHALLLASIPASLICFVAGSALRRQQSKEGDGRVHFEFLSFAFAPAALLFVYMIAAIFLLAGIGSYEF